MVYSMPNLKKKTINQIFIIFNILFIIKINTHTFFLFNPTLIFLRKLSVKPRDCWVKMLSLIIKVFISYVFFSF